MEVINIKASRNAAGSVFPFDRLYVFKEEIADIVKQGSPINISFKMTNSIKKMLGDISVETWVESGPGREKTTHALPLGYIHGKHRVSGRGLRNFGVSTEGPKKLVEELISFLEGSSEGSWYVMIPILGMSGKSGVNPRYLVNKRWSGQLNPGTYHGYQERMAKVKAGVSEIRTIPDSAVLRVLDEEITPPCLKCEHLMAHIAGECELGGRICLKSMTLSDRSVFKDGVSGSGESMTLPKVIDMIAKRNRGVSDGIQENSC